MRARSIMYHDVVEQGDFASSGFPGEAAHLYKLTREEFERHLAAIAAAIATVVAAIAPAVEVAVREFLGSGLADVDDLDREVEFLTCQGMVRVDGDLVVYDAFDGDDLRTVFPLSLELHAQL